jgi:hypothetical protein
MGNAFVTVFATCAAAITVCGAVAAVPACTDDLGTTVYWGINRLRQCAPVRDDPRLTRRRSGMPTTCSSTT